MSLSFVPNSPKYYEFIRLLRNDPRVQDGFIEQVNITPEQQEKYMSVHADKYFVCLSEGVPAGYIGVIDSDIRVATHPDFQGQGVGKFLVTQLLRHDTKVQAKIKVTNVASLALFQSAGFQPQYVIMAPTESEEVSRGTDSD